MADPTDPGPVETRLQAILEPYRTRLEANRLYGVETHRRPGARAHDWFAGIRVGRDRVSFFLKPLHTWPVLLEPVSAGLRQRMKGKTAFSFGGPDEALFAELAVLTERCYRAYEAGGPTVD